MHINKKLDKIRKKETVERSFRWYQDMIRKVGLNDVKADAVMRSNIGEYDMLRPGNMYLFIYDPKLKNTLPYYDTAPLVIVYKRTPNHFMGINVHYMPPALREVIFDKIITTINTNTLTETTKMRLTWDFLDGIAGIPDMGHCVKKYLYTNVTSRMMKIHPPDWEKALYLPVDNFVKASRLKVFRDARNR